MHTRPLRFSKSAVSAKNVFVRTIDVELPLGVYFLIVSSKTGYRPHPDKVFWATSLAGPWSGGTDIAPESTNTYNSQSTFVLTIAGSSQTTYMFMGDAWDSSGTSASNYMWLPLSVSTSAHTATLQDYAYWKVNPTTGESRPRGK